MIKTMSRTPIRKRSASVKAAADRAEKRAKGEPIEMPKIAIDPHIERTTIDREEAPKRGRATDYDPSFDARAAELCEGGAKDDELAEEFGVSSRTINRWKVAHPSFRQSLKDAKGVADERVKSSLYHKAMGVEYEEMQAIKLKTVTYKDGKRVSEEERIELVPVKKFMPADTTAAIFWLKNRQSQAWRDIHKHEHGQPGDFDNMSPDELDQFIASETEALRAPEKSVKPASKTKH